MRITARFCDVGLFSEIVDVERMLGLLAAQIQPALTVADHEGTAKEFRLLVRRSRLIHDMLCAKVEAIRQNAPSDALPR